MLEKIIIDHCAPTLCGNKIGSLVNIKNICSEFLSDYCGIKSILNENNLNTKILNNNAYNIKLYIYNEEKLKEKLQTEDVKDFLETYGYNLDSIESTLSHLKTRLTDNFFPHEIGIFLDYPLEDVKSFIDNKGKNYKTFGKWKVYNNKEKAIETFNIYDQNTIECKKMYADGCSLREIIKKAQKIA